MPNEIKLVGCVPDPLLSNLKALGIFRIVAEQVDPHVRAYWKNNNFILQTEMTKEDLVTFFLEKYLPTPIVSPWNNGGGFYDKDAKSMDAIINTKSNRMKEYQDVIKKTKAIISTIIPEYLDFPIQLKNAKNDKEIKKIVKEIKTITNEKKDKILRQCRNMLDDKIIQWFDAAYVTATQKPSYGPILGTGGNDGRFEISENFMNWISELLIKNDLKRSVYSKREALLKNSLFAEYAYLEDSSFAYFHPGRYIGPAICGDDKKYSILNPWDFVLTIEGTMLFAGSISKRSNSKRAAFPFTTYSSTAGYYTACKENTRGEIWIPLWDHPATYQEIKHVFNEGRAQVHTKDADSGVDFARSVVNMGTERGISAFHRFGIFERKGLAFLAINLGTIKTDTKPAVGLLTDLDYWLSNIKKIHQRSKNSPKSMDSLLRRINGSVIDFCTYGTQTHLQQILVMAGKIEHLISHSSNFINNDVRPMPSISYEWVKKCYDSTPEYRLAVSLATIYSENNPIRKNLEPINSEKDLTWKPKNPSFVWKNANLVNNMVSILKRRCIESRMTNKRIQLDATIPAPLKDIMQFINGNVNYDKIADLLLALSTIKYHNKELPDYYNERELWEIPDMIPEQYIILKSNFPPTKHNIKNTDLIFESNVLELLKSNRIDMAINIMRRRLFISGHPISTYSKGNLLTPIQQEHKMVQMVASLLFPIREYDMKKILSNIYIHEKTR